MSLVLVYFISYGQDIPVDCVNCDGKGLFGKYSGNIGSSNTNFGDRSLAVGEDNVIGSKTSNISSSVVMGINNMIGVDANGNNSFIVGHDNSINANESFLIGRESVISGGGGSYSIGRQNTVSGMGAMAFGSGITVDGLYSIGLGINIDVSGQGSVAVGDHAKTSENYSYAFGRYMHSNAIGAITIGVNIGANKPFLVNSQENSLMVGFNSELPTLFVSSSPAYDKTGKVSIGNITDPQAKLHIKGDSGEEAAIMLEAPASQYAGIYFNQTGKYIKSSSMDGNISFHVANGGNFMFENGDATFTQDLEVAGNINFIGELLHDGSPFETTQWEMDQGGIYYIGGNVGIGTNQTSNKLDINGTMRVSGEATFEGMIIGNGNNLSLSATGQGPDLFLDSFGRLGIGNYNPTASLDVDGTMKVHHTAIFIENVGIGITNPSEKLEIQNQSQYNKINTKMSDSEGRRLVFATKLTGYAFNPMTEPDDIGIFWSDNLGGATRNEDAGFVLAPHAKEGEPKGGIRIDHQGDVKVINLWAKRIKVNNDDPFPDYVFKEDYKLLSLKDLESYIQENHHLPNVPTAETVSKEGIDVGQMIPLLLEKIEELSLHLIEIEKKNKVMQERIVEFEK